jgi:catechol 2,3-dioxygenase-like lactoylglutathione lyase family enzyme
MTERALLGWPTWVGIVVEDLDAQRRFWGQLLGEPQHTSGPDFVHFDVGDGRSFELIKRSNEPEYDRVRFQVGFEVENVQSARDELIERGVEPITEIIAEADSPWAYFRDPEGNVFEIKQRQRSVRGT